MSQPSQPSSREETFAERHVIIKVGPSAKEFRYRKGLLTSRVPWFATALDGPFKEGQVKDTEDQSISLPQEDPAAWGILAFWTQWGYLEDIRIPNEYEGSAPSEDDLRDYEMPYHRLCYMAEMYLVPEAQNAAVEAIRKWHAHTKKSVHLDLIILGFSNTSRNSPLRLYLKWSGACAAKRCAANRQDTSRAWFTMLREREEPEIQEFVLDILEFEAYASSESTSLGDPNTISQRAFEKVRDCVVGNELPPWFFFSLKMQE